jgi:hypothetical protein
MPKGKFLMGRVPESDDWSTLALPADRRTYLDSGLSYEEIVEQSVAKANVNRVWIERYETPAPGEPNDARRVCFFVGVGKQACDLLYNAPDGLRGRYWQSPDLGFLATKYLINALKPALMGFAIRNPPRPAPKAAGMDLTQVKASLEAPSAKVWVREKDDKGDLLLKATKGSQLMVRRWLENEKEAANKDMWRRTPFGDEVEVKGAFLGPDGEEYIPEVKRDRSCQIHRFGFT